MSLPLDPALSPESVTGFLFVPLFLLVTPSPSFSCE